MANEPYVLMMIPPNPLAVARERAYHDHLNRVQGIILESMMIPESLLGLAGAAQNMSTAMHNMEVTTERVMESCRKLRRLLSGEKEPPPDEHYALLKTVGL